MLGEARRDAVRYLMDNMDKMDEMDRALLHSPFLISNSFPRGWSAPTLTPRGTSEGVERTRAYASVKVAHGVLAMLGKHGETPCATLWTIWTKWTR